MWYLFNFGSGGWLLGPFVGRLVGCGTLGGGFGRVSRRSGCFALGLVARHTPTHVRSATDRILGGTLVDAVTGVCVPVVGMGSRAPIVHFIVS